MEMANTQFDKIYAGKLIGLGIFQTYSNLKTNDMPGDMITAKSTEMHCRLCEK